MIGCYGIERGVNWSPQIPLYHSSTIPMVTQFKRLQQPRCFVNLHLNHFNIIISQICMFYVVDIWQHVEEIFSFCFLHTASDPTVRLSRFIGCEVGGSAGHRPATTGSSPVSPFLSVGPLFGV